MRMKLPLRLKTVVAIVLMGLLVGIFSIVLSYRVYSDTMDDHYKRQAVNLAKTASAMIDGEKVQQYIATLETDEDYPRQLQILEDIRVANDVDSIYVLELRETETCTILDPDPEIPFGQVDPQVQSMSQDEDYVVYISNTESYGWLCSAVVWMRDESGYGYAATCVDISMNDVMADRHDFLTLVVTTICLVVLLACVVMVLLVSKFVVKPINLLAKAAGSFVSDHQDGAEVTMERALESPGEHHVRSEQSAISKLDIHTGDEIQSLCEAIKTMELEINEYIEHLTAVTAEKERIGAELGVATQIQASMLPCIFPAFPDRPEFDVYANMHPAKEVGGDFYDFFLTDDDHLWIVIADVSGKGVPAALFMVIAKTLLKNQAGFQNTPADVLTIVNDQLCETNDAGMFVTTFMGCLEISSGRFTFANAGHNFPLIQRKGGAFDWLKTKPNFILAGMEGVRYQNHEEILHTGDRLFLYTDGVTEALNPNQELYGDDRLIQALNAPEASGLAIEPLIEYMRGSIDRFADGAAQADDITMLALEVKNNTSVPQERAT